MVYKKSKKSSKKGTKVNKSVKTYVKRTLRANVEDKYIDTVVATLIPSYTYGSLTSLNVPVLGTAQTNRIGDVVKPVKIEVKGQLYGSNSHIVRMILFRWHPNTTPVGGDILDGTYSGTFRAPFAPYYEDQTSQFTILKDKYVQCSAAGSQNAIFKFNISGKKLARQHYQASASSATNRIYCLWIQDGVTTLNTIDAVFRVWYEDA